MISIETLKQMNRPEKIVLTKHAKERLIERKISIADIISGIDNGEIIRQYEDDKPLPSCLILGRSINNACIHIVASNDEEYIYLITAYYPNPKQWESGFKVRKEC